MKKSNLDERQEQELLRIERNGFWLAFWLLVAALLVQMVFAGNTMMAMGESIILLVISLYSHSLLEGRHLGQKSEGEFKD